MRMNPFMDQGIDIRLCEGSIPMDMPDYMSSEDTDWDAAWERHNSEEEVKVLNGVLHIIEHHAVPAWRMNDGNLIAIKDMKTSHIKNCIKMIYRKNGTWRQQYLRYFENELRRRKHERTNYQEPF